MRSLSILLLLIFSLLPNYLNSFQLTSIQHGTRFMRKPLGARGLKAAVDPNHLDHLSNILTNSFQLADAAVSAYSKVDKTGFIGFIATYIEIGIDAGRSLFQTFGIQNAYGPSILLFTIIVKALTFPLQYQTLESTTKLQKIQPLQQKVMEKYANDQQTKNLVLSQLLQAAKVNPLAGCFPALVQIPIFISLYRALTNLVAENKLAESFLWIPDLQGPVFSKPPAEALDWLKTIVTGNPELGWEKTIAYLSIPVLLFVSQSISQKLLQPPRDPNKQLTDQEQFSQSLVNNLPFIVTFFSLSVPAGLEVYWIANNIFSTIITLAVKNSIKDEPFPIEVDRIMASLDGPSTGEPVPFPTTDNKVFKSLLDDRPKPTGFAKLADEGSASPTQDLSSSTAVPIKVEEVKTVAPTSNNNDATASTVPPVAPTPIRSEVNRSQSQSNRKKRRQKN